MQIPGSSRDPTLEASDLLDQASGVTSVASLRATLTSIPCCLIREGKGTKMADSGHQQGVCVFTESHRSSSGGGGFSGGYVSDQSKQSEAR